MSSTSPMRGRRVHKTIRCPVQGHPTCEVTRASGPPSRRQERGRWRCDVEPELEPVPDYQLDPMDDFSIWLHCSSCGVRTNVWEYHDGDPYCLVGAPSCYDRAVLEAEAFRSVIDLGDPFIQIILPS